jgi:hypothetical protein
MAKHFRFVFHESHEEGEMTFNDVEYPYDKELSSHVSFESSTQWDNIIREFAHFLDSTGYVGVYDRVSALLDGYWEPVYKFTEEDVTDEDSSDTGLSGKAGCTD